MTEEVFLGDDSSVSSDKTVFMSPISRVDDPDRLVVIGVEDGSVDEPPITEEERILTQPVQNLLDLMNSASCRMNDLELEIHALELDRSATIERWNEKKTQIIESIGAHVIEKARPLFDAHQEQLTIQASVNEAVEMFSNATQQCEVLRSRVQQASEETLFQLIETYVASQKSRDLFEQLSLDRTREFNDAQIRCNDLRKSIGMKVIERAWPWYEAFNKAKSDIDRLTGDIRQKRIDLKLVREQYKNAMAELEAISAKVHALRKQQQHAS
jgi:hypothetical protein